MFENVIPFNLERYYSCYPWTTREPHYFYWNF